MTSGTEALKQQLEEFHRSYLVRTIGFSALAAWVSFVGFWHRGFSPVAFEALLGFLALCLVNFWLLRRRPPLARHGVVIGFGLWALGLTWLLGEPLALFTLVLAGQIGGALLSPPVALGYVGLMVLGIFPLALRLFPEAAWTPQVVLPALLTVMATVLSLFWANNLTLALAWAYHSTQDALKRLADAQEHRAKLYRMMKDLDEAYSRLARANHMLILARAEAEEAREARNRFILAVSHELRAPLNFIIGFSELMVNSPATYAPLDRWPPGLYEDVREIYRSSQHLLHLVNDVLELGQIEAQRMMLVKEWVDPAQLVGEVEAMVRSAFARKGLWLRLKVEPDLPNVFVDRTRIRQVLLNLVSNSLRFTEQGGVTIRLQKSQGALIVCVEDTGPGIAPEDIPKVFEEFRQVGTNSWRRREGTGLGLAISRRFVELHGGRMWLESRVGEGSAFYFSLPLPGTAQALSSEADLEAAEARYWQYLERKAERERTLLVFSADPLAGEVIARCVEAYCVAAVTHPDQVPARVAELLPHALIVDQATIEEETARAVIEKLPYDLPVIGFRLPGYAVRPADLPTGVSDYLVKPISRSALAEAIRSLGPGVRDLLVVDDDPAMVRFVTLALQGKGGNASSEGGYRLITASTGQEALERLRRDRPDAVLLDLALPDLSGWEVLERIRQDPGMPPVPVILITAHDWPQMLPAERERTLEVWMRRPLSRQELTVILKSLLGAVRPMYPTVSAGSAQPAGLSG
ncbi:MAG: ATP-binding protein [Anaerolineae bacterium]|nr:ATP-binding protein [Anaerolineae bacterium]MDW8100578.1 ATP-binding protein [Anaerolineae bacterium]